MMTKLVDCQATIVCYYGAQLKTLHLCAGVSVMRVDALSIHAVFGLVSILQLKRGELDSVW